MYSKHFIPRRQPVYVQALWLRAFIVVMFVASVFIAALSAYHVIAAILPALGNAVLCGLASMLAYILHTLLRSPRRAL